MNSVAVTLIGMSASPAGPADDSRRREVGREPVDGLSACRRPAHRRSQDLVARQVGAPELRHRRCVGTLFQVSAIGCWGSAKRRDQVAASSRLSAGNPRVTVTGGAPAARCASARASMG